MCRTDLRKKSLSDSWAISLIKYIDLHSNASCNSGQAVCVTIETLVLICPLCQTGCFPSRTALLSAEIEFHNQLGVSPKKSQAIICSLSCPKKLRQVLDDRSNAGVIRCRLRILCTDVALNLWPSLSSSLWILSYPRRGFSFASRKIKVSSSDDIVGLPGFAFRLKVHSRRTNSRCHRRTVSSLKINMT
jgi:hypothetical protein